MLVNISLLIIVCIAFCEILAKSAIFERVNSLVKVAKKSSKVLSSKRISDHWKEQILPYYSKSIFASSFYVLLVLLGLIVLVFVLDYFADGFLTFLMTPIGLIGALIVGFGYAKIRKMI